MRKRRRRHPPFPLFYQTNTKNFLIITQDEEDDDGDFKVHKKSDKQIVGGKVLDTFEDETLSCRDCAEDFVFTSGEQEFYASKGWENKPTRCEACRTAKKARLGKISRSVTRTREASAQRRELQVFAALNGRTGAAAAAVASGVRASKGECTRGDSCKFSHEEGGVAVPDRRRGAAGRRGRRLLAFFEGWSMRGDSCRFSRAPPAESFRLVLRVQESATEARVSIS